MRGVSCVMVRRRGTWCCPALVLIVALLLSVSGVASAAQTFKIAFLGMAADLTCDLWTVNSDGTSLNRLTKNWGIYDFSVAPDGSRILFWGMKDGIDRTGPTCHYTVSADGKLLTKYSENSDMLPGPSGVLMYDWAPDSKSVAFNFEIFADYRADDEMQIATYNLGSKQIRKLTDKNVGYGNWNPRWSPDGNWILFVTGAVSPWNGGDGLSRVRIIRPDGSSMKTVFTGGDGTSACWSPDGTRIWYENYVLDLSGRVVAKTGVPSLSTVFCSPGNFCVAEFGGRVIYNVGGGGQVRTLATNQNIWGWSPDGSMAVMSRGYYEEDDAAPGIFLLDTRSGMMREVPLKQLLDKGIVPVYAKGLPQ